MIMYLKFSKSESPSYFLKKELGVGSIEIVKVNRAYFNILTDNVKIGTLELVKDDYIFNGI